MLPQPQPSGAIPHKTGEKPPVAGVVPYAIVAQDLVKRYGQIEALRGVSFEIPQGEIVAFLGPNSAGKSTTLKILAGIMPATAGEVTVAGYSAAYQEREIKRVVGYMPEHNPLPEELTIEEFLSYRARLKEIRGGSRVRSRVAEVSAMCELQGKLMRRPIGVLSRGVRQRVGIADALLTSPPILLFDEPTIGLDPHQVIALRDLILSMRGRHTILLSTHILSEAEAMADRLLIINKGQKVACGTPAELKKIYASSNRLHLTTTLPAEVLREMLTAMGGSLDEIKIVEDDAPWAACWVSLPSDALVEPLVRQIASHPEGHLREFVKIRPSLESIFLRAIQPGIEVAGREDML